METTVTLQNPLQFRIIWIIIPFVLLLVIFLLQYIAKKKWPLPDKERNIVVKTPPRLTRIQIRQKYTKKCNELEASINEGNTNIRDGYQELSYIIRNFVYEMTGIEVQNCTLEEIRTVQIPELTSLVEEYYEPEFARESKGEVLASLDKTRSVILSWK